MIAAMLRAAAEQTGDARLIAELGALEKRVDRFSNLSGVIKGLGKSDFSDGLCAAALGVVRGLLSQDAEARRSSLEQHVDDALFDGWAAICLAARAQPAIIDQVADALTRDYAVARIRELRRVTDEALTRRAEQGAGVVAEKPAEDLPQSVSKVKAWLAAHPDPDPAQLAPKPKQKATAKAAAVRALGQIGTPAAFEVLKNYATDSPSSPLLEELKRAWAHFDRREYAAAMLVPSRGHLSLDIVIDIEGIDAVADMTSLRIVVDDLGADQTDLSPLAECAQLRALDIQFSEPASPSQIDWLRPLTGLRALALGIALRGTDLSALSGSNVERLSICIEKQDPSILLDMSELSHLTVTSSASASAQQAQGDLDKLTGVVLSLAERGVPVMVYDFDKQWVSGLLPAAQQAGLQVTAGHGVKTIHREDGVGTTGSPMADRFFV